MIYLTTRCFRLQQRERNFLIKQKKLLRYQIRARSLPLKQKAAKEQAKILDSKGKTIAKSQKRYSTLLLATILPPFGVKLSPAKEKPALCMYRTKTARPSRSTNQVYKRSMNRAER